ncbi:cyclin-dependent kinase 2-like [Tribolium madens]|uniref:cyclin-dependent kinase 2-like n=1 Tax=Tribolium madens TaxID=41895 RepID=UPI001CF73AAD|nr:cyclin-dependent kinase 2-like [Tribolium madens]
MNTLDKFIKLGTAGEGTYGIVYKAKNKVTGKSVALKRIKLEKFSKNDYTEGVPSTAIREIAILKGLRHSAIIELQDVMYTSDKLYLVFEYLDLDLRRYLDGSTKPLEKELIRNYMKQLCEGLAYLHTQRILHRDIKPQNLLVDKEGHIKIADFGLSRCFSIPTKPYTHEVVTMWYRAPELLLGSKLYTNGIDVWSVGCVMAEMLLKRALFPGDSEIDQMFKIFKTLGTPNEDVWPGVSSLPAYEVWFPQWKPCELNTQIKFNDSEEEEFLKLLLVYDPFVRKSSKELLSLPYIRKAKLTTPDMKPFPDAEEDFD